MRNYINVSIHEVPPESVQAEHAEGFTWLRIGEAVLHLGEGVKRVALIDKICEELQRVRDATLTELSNADEA